VTESSVHQNAFNRSKSTVEIELERLRLQETALFDDIKARGDELDSLLRELDTCSQSWQRLPESDKASQVYRDRIRVAKGALRTAQSQLWKNIGYLRKSLKWQSIKSLDSPSLQSNSPRQIDSDSSLPGRLTASAIAMAKQRDLWHHKRGAGDQGGRLSKKAKKAAASNLASCGNADVLLLEAQELIAKPRLDSSTVKEANVAPAAQGYENMDVTVEAFSSVGEGLARHPEEDHVFVIPFALVGERVKINVRTPQYRERIGISSSADLVEVLEPSPQREGVTPKCKYFGQCGGCQLQMISYEDQLKQKKTVLEEAYRRFSGLDRSDYPAIGETGPSPLQYEYRTKLTPHFDTPHMKDGAVKVPPIGLTRKGRMHVMDIEACSIASPIVNEGLRRERANVAKSIVNYKRGATILVRETTMQSYTLSNSSAATSESHTVQASEVFQPASLEELPPANDPDVTITDTPTGPVHITTHNLTSPPGTITQTKSYTTNSTALATEHIGSFTFKTAAGSFFQNNNSILPSFLRYVRSVAQPPSTSSHPPLKYLLDAYCGSGLFALTLASQFASVLGIELDERAVRAARANAAANAVQNAGFIHADAAQLFADVPYPSAQTALVIDPPRKGCDVNFLKQLLDFGPMRVVYVSCNVHTQARDVGCLVRGRVGPDWWRGEGVVGRWRYVVEELKGWDFFPQTGHVEGLCVLRRVDNEAWTGEGVERPEISGRREGEAKRKSSSEAGVVDIFEGEAKTEIGYEEALKETSGEKV
jgi:tRNA (uracil-5-)-methyltransferase